jgi:8-oxo-dGTP pyrophosphatase MutT (NUDIX family)
VGNRAKKSTGRRRQVAALPFRTDRDGIKIMMITSRSGKRWLLPKGNLMPNRTAWTAAAIEAWEEAGVAGRIHRRPLGRFRFRKRARGGMRLHAVEVFPLKVERQHQNWPEAKDRDRAWVPLSEASRLARWKGLAKVLSRATLAWGRGVRSERHPKAPESQ